MNSLFYFLDANFWKQPLLVGTFTASVLVVLLLRYFTTAVLYRSIVRNIFGFKIRRQKRLQLKREIIWSIISSLIFTVMAVGTFYLYQRGYTKVYTEMSAYSAAYFVASIPLFLILYETYYYWLHRWMHLPSVFKIVHRVHHQSMEPTVFTSFAFHPLEAILQFIFVPLMILIFPIHYYALGIVLMIWTVSAVVNHAGAEIFPKNFINHPVGKWLIGSTHHDLHHKEFKTNFGLYLTFWDKWMNTESKNFEQQFITRKTINRFRSPHRPSMDDQHR